MAHHQQTTNMTNNIKCVRCQIKYDNDDNTITAHFGYNKLGERFKCCCKCREYVKISGATYRKTHKEELNKYSKTYYQEHKEELMKKDKEYTQKKKAELNDIIAKGELSNFKHIDNNITPHFDDLTKKKQIRLRYNINGIRFEKVLGYKKKGYTETKQELEQYFERETTKS
jgi:hypothetical protein